jgi:cobalt-zinc-cadmium efflux system membrane fusion protein
MNNSLKLTYAWLSLLSLLFFTSCQEEKTKSKQDNAQIEKSTPHDLNEESHNHEERHGPHGEGGELCSLHQAPKDDCWICDPSLRDKSRLWCKEHSTYEDRCWICHPELQNKERLYCKEHGIYEDECVLCHPELKKTNEVSQLKSIESQGTKEVFCSEHQLLERECAICQPDLLKNLIPGKGMKVRLPSKASALKAGVKIEAAEPIQLGTTTSKGFLARVDYNQNLMTHIVPKTEGTMGEVLVDNGYSVKKDQVLGNFISPVASKLKSEFIAALADSTLKAAAYLREKSLTEQNASSRQELEVAHAEFQKAKAFLDAATQQLKEIGLASFEIDQIRKNQDASSTLLLRAPFKGTVVQRTAVLGAAASANSALFTLVDLSDMWLEMSVPASIALGLNPGDLIAVHFPELGTGKIAGKVIWVSSEIEASTRMVPVRAIIPNPNGLLKKGLYGEAQLISQEKSGLSGALQKVSVPTSALQRIEGNHYVFVPVEDDLYEVRNVRIESQKNRSAVISEGLFPGEPIVIAGSFTLRSEMFKSSFGAGCAGHH